jgi:hypothetical protein
MRSSKLAGVALGLAEDEDADALLEDREPEGVGEDDPRQAEAAGLEDDDRLVVSSRSIASRWNPQSVRG